MPIYKFKSFQEAEQALWNFSPDADYYARLRDFFRLAARLYPKENSDATFVRGFHKFKTIQSAKADRDRNNLP